MGALSRLEHLPLTRKVLLLVVFSELSNDLVGNGLKVMRSQGKDGRAGTGKAHAEEAFVGLGRHGLDDLSETGDKGLAVGLVDLVLHGEVDELRVRGGLAEGDGQKSNSLQVEDLGHSLDSSLLPTQTFNVPHRGECSSQVELLAQHV